MTKIPDPIDLDTARLGEGSQLLAARLFARHPQIEQFARMQAVAGTDEFDLLVEIPSPTGDPKRKVVIWMEPDEEASIGFGEWHTHAGLLIVTDDIGEEVDSIVDLASAIMDDMAVLIYDVGGEHNGAWGFVDLRNENALTEELTDQFSSGRVQVVTWSGRHDREVGLSDLA